MTVPEILLFIAVASLLAYLGVARLWRVTDRLSPPLPLILSLSTLMLIASCCMLVATILIGGRYD